MCRQKITGGAEGGGYATYKIREGGDQLKKMSSLGGVIY